ncbi:HEAT repeat domain-containing protein [Candidatus Halobeggiatoa sp. HSG11]|nr:HEAT repeat domain-containing protein [Candidatus Halobeggiatoa sp. HSG11]
MKPYKGLTPYKEQDKDNFFGRDAEKLILIDKILTHKLTFLFAASGVGKSSLLRAAVLPELKQPERMDREPLDVVYYNDWVGNPLVGLKKAIVKDLQKKGQLTADYSLDVELALPEFFHICTAFTSDPLVVILDQFEEFFNYQKFSEYFKLVIEELAAAIHDRETETVFVISMREDFALELNAFKDYIPTFLIDNFYRLEKLSLEKARQAVVEPVAALGFEYESVLLERLLQDLLLREQRERGLEAAVAGEDLPPMVEPPHLQMVCMQLWDLRDVGKGLISEEVFASRGGTDGLLEAYFLDKVNSLSGGEQRLASLAFDFLVNRHGTKMPRSLPDLVGLIRVKEGVLFGTLEKLDKARILLGKLRYGTASADGVLWYELHHDFFSKPIYVWNEGFKTRQRIRKVSFGVGAVIGVGLVAVVAWDAWVNYSSYHLRLSVKSGLSDTVEVFRGEAGSWDLFGQQGFVGEMVYEREDIEADKLFVEQSVVEFEGLNSEVVGRLPLADRVAAYLDNGDLDKALDLARCVISDEDLQLSKKILIRLARFRSIKTFGVLETIFKEKISINLKEEIIKVLGRSQNINRTLPLLLSALQDKNRNIRYHAAIELGKFENNLALKPLINLLSEQYAPIRREAAISLGKLKSKNSIVYNSLITLLNDQEPLVRQYTVEALGNLGGDKVIEPLIAKLEDSDSKVFRATVRVLIKLKNKMAIKALVSLPDSLTKV